MGSDASLNHHSENRFEEIKTQKLQRSKRTSEA
jgi:hypothetical protein